MSLLSDALKYCADTTKYYLDPLLSVDRYRSMSVEDLVSSMASKNIGMTDNLCTGQNPKDVKTVLSGAIAGDNLALVQHISSTLTVEDLNKDCYRGPRVKIDSPKNNFSFTPIYYTLTFDETPNRLGMLKTFLEKGANPNLHDAILTPVLASSDKFSPKVISLLVEHGASLGQYTAYQNSIENKIWEAYKTAFMMFDNDAILPKELAQMIKLLFAKKVAPRSLV